MPQSGIAIVRQCLAVIPSVSGSWFEWSQDDDAWLTTLVVEVDVNTDPSGTAFTRGTLDAIAATVRGVASQSGVSIHKLRVVPMK